MEIITEAAQLERAGFYWRERAEGVRVLSCLPLERDGFVNGFSTRLGGVSPMPQDALNLAGFNEDSAENIYENRRRFLNLFDGEWTLTACWQVHGSDVRSVKDEEEARGGMPGTVGEVVHCDSLITSAPRVLLGVKTADCVPVLLGDARTGGCAAIHAGWRGTLARIVGRTLESMRREYGTRAADVRAAIGPAAGGCCYEVGPDVIDAFRREFADTDELLTPTHGSHARIDIQRANRNQLLEAGLDAEQIHLAPLCTMCRTDLFFSYRREKSIHGRVGRLMSVIGRRGAES